MSQYLENSNRDSRLQISQIRGSLSRNKTRGARKVLEGRKEGGKVVHILFDYNDMRMRQPSGIRRGGGKR